jgi:hypothetical protein
VNASQTTPLMLLMFVMKKMANAHAIKIMMVESAIVVMMNTMIILIVMIVDALQITP